MYQPMYPSGYLLVKKVYGVTRSFLGTKFTLDRR